MNIKLDKFTSRPDQVFRLAGLLSCLIVGLTTIFAHLYGSASSDVVGLVDSLRRHLNLPIPSAMMVTLDLLAFLIFGLAFRRNMASERLFNPDRMSIVLLALQSTIGLLFAAPLFFLIAAEVSFILAVRQAVLWVLAQLVAGIALVLILPRETSLGFLSGSDAPRSLALLLECLMYPMILSFSYCLGLVAATEWRHRRELARVNAELKATQELQADSVRMAERLHISRELHDALGHHLAALSVNLQLASRLTEGEAAGLVQESHLIARTLLADVRDVVSSMRYDSSIDLWRALETLAAGVKHPTIHIEVPDELKNADPLQAHTLFRCVQKIITNTMRHAGARNLWLTISRDEDGLSLHACDDGRGAAELKPGNGLRGMRERVEEYGGRLQIESNAGSGFAARVWLPATGGA